MSLTVVGINHRTAPIEIRERLAWAEAEVPGVVRRVLGESGGAGAGVGAVLLSTCNRIEFYLVDATSRTLAQVWHVAAERLGAPAEAYAYVRQDREAVRHLFRVAAGLDSMVLGESQIQGQVRETWELCRDRAGAVLNRLFQSALQVGGRVRSETAIGAGAASVPSASVDLARKIFGHLAGRQALVLGSGEMAELAMGCLTDEGVRTVMVAHRHVEHAAMVASRVGGQAVTFDEAWPLFAEVDVVVSSTAAPHAIVTRGKVAAFIARRAGRPLCILDIAVPRDVAPDVGRLDNVFLYDIDDLQGVVAASLSTREQKTPEAERIVLREVGYFWDWYRGRGVVDVIRELRGRMDAMRARELERALKKLAHLPPEDRERVEHLTRALMNKFLHEPTVRLRGAAGNGTGARAADVIRYLFGLEWSSTEEGEGGSGSEGGGA